MNLLEAENLNAENMSVKWNLLSEALRMTPKRKFASRHKALI
jgi:hypothetical protein